MSFDAFLGFVINVVLVGVHDGLDSELLFSLILILVAVSYFFPFLNSRTVSEAGLEVSTLEWDCDEFRWNFNEVYNTIQSMAV